MYSYSSDEERYWGPYETRDAAIEAAKSEGLECFWTGKNRAPHLGLSCLRADSIIEHILNDEEDFQIDAAGDWPSATKDQMDELTIILQAAFGNWMVRHNLKPTFFVVQDVEKHEPAAPSVDAA